MRTVTYRVNRRTFEASKRTDTDRAGYPKGWLVIEKLRDGWNCEVGRGIKSLRAAKEAARLEAGG